MNASAGSTSSVVWQGQDALRVEHASGASATIALHGAHVVSWCTADGRERLYLSPSTRHGNANAVRGGVPVIFPRFALRGPCTQVPRHGFARNRPWRRAKGIESHGTSLRLSDDDATRALWPHRFELQLHVVVDERQLSVEMACRNTGDAAFAFNAALHSYFAVDGIDGTSLEGLQGTRFLDTLTGVEHIETASRLTFDGREIDRIHWAVGESPLMLVEPGRRLRIQAVGLPDVVVWNPGPVKAAELDDLGAGEERRFVCVEAAAVESHVVLAPGQCWSGAQRATALD